MWKYITHIYIYILYIYSALHKYWNSKDKIALLAVESRHLQIWLKDEYETKLQHFQFIPLFDVSISIGTVEHKADIQD